MKEIFKNPLLWYFIIVLSLISWWATRLVKKIITVEKQQTMKKTNGKIEPVPPTNIKKKV